MRRALRQALDAEVERRMAHAYRRQPDNAEPEVIDPRPGRHESRRSRAGDAAVETVRALVGANARFADVHLLE